MEMKDFDNPDFYDTEDSTAKDEPKDKKEHFKWLKDYFKYKFRDSYLFRFTKIRKFGMLMILQTVIGIAMILMGMGYDLLIWAIQILFRLWRIRRYLYMAVLLRI